MGMEESHINAIENIANDVDNKFKEIKDKFTTKEESERDMLKLKEELKNEMSETFQTQIERLIQRQNVVNSVPSKSTTNLQQKKDQKENENLQQKKDKKQTVEPEKTKTPKKKAGIYPNLKIVEEVPLLSDDTSEEENTSEDEDETMTWAKRMFLNRGKGAEKSPEPPIIKLGEKNDKNSKKYKNKVEEVEENFDTAKWWLGHKITLA